MTSNEINIGTVGTHCILEMSGCRPELLNDADFILRTLRDAALQAGATYLKETYHCFEPQGVTAAVLLAESHISIHTWPEAGYAAVDVFTCGDHTMPENACHFIVRSLESSQYTIQLLKRRPPQAFNATTRMP